MEDFLKKLRGGLPFLEHRWFNWLLGLVIFANPLALLPQAIGVFTTPSTEGISVLMFSIFALIQLACAAIGIQKLDWRMFFSMVISFSESMLIIIVVLIRR